MLAGFGRVDDSLRVRRRPPSAEERISERSSGNSLGDDFRECPALDQLHHGEINAGGSSIKWIVTMFGCASAAIAVASRSARPHFRVDARWRGRTLIATSRPSRVSRARYAAHAAHAERAKNRRGRVGCRICIAADCSANPRRAEMLLLLQQAQPVADHRRRRVFVAAQQLITNR